MNIYRKSHLVTADQANPKVGYTFWASCLLFRLTFLLIVGNSELNYFTNTAFGWGTFLIIDVLYT